MAKKKPIKVYETNVNYKTKKPTGLSIKRSGSTFTFEWKNADSSNSIKVAYRIHNSSKWLAWNYVDLGGSATKTSVTLKNADYWPTKNAVATSIEFGIKAFRNKWINTKETSTAIYNTFYNTSWSDWAYKTFTIAKPSKPSLSATLSDDVTNVTTFAWSTSEGANQIVHDVQWQTQLVSDSNVTDGSKLNWDPEKAPIAGWNYGTGGLSGSRAVTDNTVSIATGSHTRWFRCRARGKSGNGEWAYAKHVYAVPNQAKINNASAGVTTAGGYSCYVNWTASAPASRPIDKTIVQYTITVPTGSLGCPNGASWTDGNATADTKGSDACTITIDDVLDLDQCLFVRVNTLHDSYITYGTPYRVQTGKLKKPVNLSVLPNPAEYTATVHAEHDSEVDGSFIVVEFQDGSNQPETVGIIPSTAQEVTIQCPQWNNATKTNFFVYECVGTYSKVTKSYDSYRVDKKMFSDKEQRGGDVPLPPSGVTAQLSGRPGVVTVSWNWSWAGANSAEIAWADHDDAWESTDEPETYTISRLYASRWNIAGLASGVRWYFRVRLINSSGDGADTLGPWSALTDASSVDMSSAPSIPVLTLGDGSQGVITETGSIVASWVYVATDNTSQAYAEICDIADISQIDQEYILSTDTTVREWKEYFTRSGSGTAQSPYVYTTTDIVDTAHHIRRRPTGSPSAQGWYEKNRAVVAHTTSAQSVTLDAQQIGWKSGETHLLAVRVKSSSGLLSEGWSDPVALAIADPLEIAITETSLEEITIVEDEGERTVMALTKMTEDDPFTVTVTGAGADGITSVSVVRAEAYHMDRPDEDIFNGFKDEVVLLSEHIGEEQFVLTQRDIVGHLDDGASYRLIATIRDSLGQKAETEIPFEVRWTHQAIMPEATCEIDEDNFAVILHIGTPTGAGAGDTVDIYRLSTDKPELIYESAPLGSTIVDPYPAIGENGGHRIVYKTINGDYITEDNEPAWIDLGFYEDDYIESELAVLDYDRGQIQLAFDIQLSHSWEKDFKETRYLGGSIQGDWNPAVGRTSSVSASVIQIVEKDVILGMRRIAVSPAICHIRTPDGSSFAADIEVSESSGADRGGKIYSYSLNITRVDPQTLDGMTYEDWMDGRGEARFTLATDEDDVLVTDTDDVLQTSYLPI